MTSYHLIPRDPTVLGDGRPLERQSAQVWPIPATLTAAVNRWAYDASGHRDHTELHLISKTLRGPLLFDGQQLYVPPPADARLASTARGAPWVGGELLDGTSALWPEGFPALPLLHHLPERDRATREKRPEIEGAVGLDDAIRWAMGQQRPERGARVLWRDEERMHVSIDPRSGAAADGALFRTAGVRLEEDVGWAFAWDGPPLLAGRDSLVPFGGEGRQGWLEPLRTSPFPDFSAYEAMLDRVPGRGAWLRVQLLTPGLFGTDLTAAPDVPAAPTWLLQKAERGCGRPLSLVGMTLGRYRAFSGWKQGRKRNSENDEIEVNQPRAVRRCVPAGAVYWLGDGRGRPLDPAGLAKAVRALWLAPFDLPAAPASRQGFGLALPGFTPTLDEVAP